MVTGEREHEEGKLGNWTGKGVKEGPNFLKQQADNISLPSEAEIFPLSCTLLPSGLEILQGQGKEWETVSLLQNYEFLQVQRSPQSSFLWLGTFFSAQPYPLFFTLHLVS